MCVRTCLCVCVFEHDLSPPLPAGVYTLQLALDIVNAKVSLHEGVFVWECVSVLLCV